MKKCLQIIILSVFFFILYFIPARIAPFDQIWFDTLSKPIFTPPQIVFPIVWTILFVLISVSAVLTILSKTTEKRFYMILLILNYLFIQMYSYIQFELKDTPLAFVDVILVLITSFMLFISGCKINKKASYLLIPVLIWVIFVSFIQVGILKYN